MGKGMVMLPILEMATKTGETMEAARLNLMDNFLLPSVFWALVMFPNSMNQNIHPRPPTPVKIGLAPACFEWMVVCD